jgi:hypothetical protein
MDPRFFETHDHVARLLAEGDVLRQERRLRRIESTHGRRPMVDGLRLRLGGALVSAGEAIAGGPRARRPGRAS